MNVSQRTMARRMPFARAEGRHAALVVGFLGNRSDRRYSRFRRIGWNGRGNREDRVLCVSGDLVGRILGRPSGRLSP